MKIKDCYIYGISQTSEQSEKGEKFLKGKKQKNAIYVLQWDQ